jgi:MarR family transcriptional regulator for hemolysin
MSSPPTEPIGLQLTRASKMVSRAFDEALSAAGGSLPEWLILMSLKASTHGNQRELAESIGIEGPTLTHHLNRMEKAGLLTRTRDPDNRRVHRVELTANGETMFRNLVSTVRRFDSTLRAGFSDRELATLIRLLARLRDNVDTATIDETPQRRPMQASPGRRSQPEEPGGA